MYDVIKKEGSEDIKVVNKIYTKKKEKMRKVKKNIPGLACLSLSLAH